jgi:hypothetical protein
MTVTSNEPIRDLDALRPGRGYEVDGQLGRYMGEGSAAWLATDGPAIRFGIFLFDPLSAAEPVLFGSPWSADPEEVEAVRHGWKLVGEEELASGSVEVREWESEEN